MTCRNCAVDDLEAPCYLLLFTVLEGAMQAAGEELLSVVLLGYGHPIPHLPLSLQ